jgi:hypothetical protein
VTSLSQTSGNLGLIGISQFVNRPEPNGPDQYHNQPFGSQDVIQWGWWPFLADETMTGVTASLIGGGGEDQMTGLLTVSLWS